MRRGPVMVDVAGLAPDWTSHAFIEETISRVRALPGFRFERLDISDRAAMERLFEGSAFDVAVPGESEASDLGRADRFAEHAKAGATWWVEAVHPWRFGYEEGGAWPTRAMLNEAHRDPLKRPGLSEGP